MPKPKSEKSNFRINLEYYPFLLLYSIIHAMPLKLGYALSALLFRGLPLVDRRHWRRSVEHLMHAGIAGNEAEAKKIAHASNLEFSKLLVEIVKMDQLYRPEKIKLSGSQESIDALFHRDGTPGEQVIIITAHYGNWEVAGQAFSEQAHRPMASLMRPFGNPKIGAKILAHRAGSMHELVNKEDGIRPILRAAAKGKNLTMLIDQHAASSEGVVCEFFGHPARVHMTPALLHLKTKIRILPEVTRRVGDNFDFELVVGDLISYTPTGNKERDVQELTQLCISGLEKLLRDAPEQWLWAPRHWLDITRRQAAEYQNWQRPAYSDSPKSE